MATPTAKAKNRSFAARISSKDFQDLFLKNSIQSLLEWFELSTISKKREFFAAIGRDISERRQVEKNLENANIAARNVLEDLSVEKEALAHAKAKDDALLESLGEGIIAVDNDRKVLLINKVAKKMLGLSAKDLIGKELADFPLEDEAGNPIPLDKKPAALSLSSGETVKVTYFLVRKDKTRFPMMITATPIRLHGRMIGMIEIIRDITIEKEIDKAKSEFVSLASHQLRTPLTTTSWYTELILKGDFGKVVPRQRKYLKEIYQSNKRMVELVNTLLDVSRLELGTFKIDPEPTDMTALVRSVLKEQGLKIKKKKLAVIEKFSKKIPLFFCDPKLFRMVFQNILNNAIEYTPSRGRIELSISLLKKNTLMMKISDTGCGIPSNQQSRIFTKLFRADNVREKGTDGTGLGLYIAKSIVEKSGGKIWFESKENKGTTFYVTLPLEARKK